MQLSINKSSYGMRIAFALIVLFILLSGIIFVSRVSAQTEAEQAPGNRLVTIYDRGQEKVIVTKEKTIGEALKAANIQIDAEDSVEPALKEEMVASQYHVNIYRARPVVIVDGAHRYKIVSAYQTPKQIAEEANVQLYPEDSVELAPSRDIALDGVSLRLTITRATPVTLILYGKKIDARTNQTTVGAMLKEKDIKLEANDTLTVPENTTLTAGMQIEIWRNGIQTVTEEKEVEFTVEKIQDANREVGYREIKTPGEKGMRTVTFEIEMKNGQEVNRKEIQSVVTKEPKKQVEIVGAKPSFTGGFADALATLRKCESGGNYAINTGNGYYGAYQFSASSWRSWAPDEYKGVTADQAPPAAQDQAVWNYYQKSGWNPWPGCKAKHGLPDIYR